MTRGRIGTRSCARNWKLARQKQRYGYRRLHAVLESWGEAVNMKRIYRLYAEEGLAVRRGRRKRLVRDRVAEPRLIRANEEWAMDFSVDGLVNERMVRILSVVDALLASAWRWRSTPAWAAAV